MTTKAKSPTPTSEPTDMAAGRVGKTSQAGPEHRMLNALVGKWITVGHTIASAGAPAVKINASDVYEWAPGGFFVLHTAYGRIGDVGVGAIEVIGYDTARKKYQTRFFDNQGNTEQQELLVRGNTWTWTGEKTRCTAVTSLDGKSMTAHHERTDDGVKWIPSMDVTLTKVE